MYAINLRKTGGYFGACFVAVITLGLFMPQAFAADIIVARYEAEGPLMSHQAGSAITGAWRINQSGSTYSTFGPYELEKIPYGSNIQLKARFRLRVDNNVGTTNVCKLDVMRSRYRPGTLGANGTILGTPLTLTRSSFSAANTWQDFDVTFNYAKDSGYETRIEFRTEYLGNNTQLDQDYVEVIYVATENIVTAPSAGSYTYTFDPETHGATKFNADTVHPNTYVQDDGSTSMVWATDNAAAVGFCQWHFNAGSGRTFSNNMAAYSSVYFFSSAGYVKGFWSTDGINWTQFWNQTGSKHETISLSSSGYTGSSDLYIRYYIFHYYNSASINQIQLWRSTGTNSFTLSGTVLAPAPPPPTGGTSTANSTTQITWGWTKPGSGYSYRGYDASSGGNLKWTSATDASSYQEGSLTANTAYTRHVATYDGYQNSATRLAIGPRYTLIQTATGVTFGTITVNSIQAAPAGTFTNLTTGSSGVRTKNTTAGGDSGWVQNQNLWTSSSLNTNTQYTFEVGSRNAEGVRSADVSASKYTLQASATKPTVTANSISQLTVATTGPVNLSAGSSGVIFKRDGTTDLTKVQALSRADTGLGTNTAHTYTARGVNGDGVETAQSAASDAKYTLQAAATTPTVVADSTSQLTVSTTGPTNLTAGLSGVIFKRDGTTDLAKVQALSRADTGLGTNTAHTYTARGVNGDGVETAQSSASAAKYTLQAAATTPTVVADSTTQLTVTTTGPINLTLGSSGVIFKRDGTTDLTKVQALSRADSGLGVNTSHTYTARGVNGDGVETAQSSASTAKYTLQATPTAPTFSNVTTSGFRISTTGPVNLTSGSSGVIFHDGTADRTKVTVLYDDVSGLTANTQYTFKAKGVNGDGVVTAYSGTASQWTLSIPPTSGSVTPDDTSPCPGDPINWTAVGGFGAGKVQYYRYVWDQNATHSWTDTETQWSSGTIQTSPTAGGTWYLHVKGYNGANVGNGTYDYAVTALPAPVAPTDDTPFEDGTDTITWTWFDVSGEQGYRVKDTSGNDKSGDLAADLTEWQETGLTANTQYTRKIYSFNACGESAGSSGQSRWTLSLPPDEESVETASSPCVGDDVVWTAVDGFGAGGVQYYRYAWDQNASHTWTGSETQWSSGNLSLPTSASGTWYLHVKGYNGANVANGDYSYSVQVKAGTEVTAHPEDQNVVDNGTAVFTAAGTGAGTVTYQWQKYNAGTETWEDLDGETDDTLEIEYVTEADEGFYQCVISADCGPVETTAAELTIAPQILYWESVKTHGGVGEIALAMPSGMPLVEPRRGDLLIRVVLDREVLAVDGTLDANDLSIKDSGNNGYTPKALAFNNGSQGDELQITLDGAQVDQKRLTVELTEGKFRRPSSTKALLAGTRNRQVRCLVGDVSGDGVVDTADLSTVKAQLFKNTDTGNARCDVNNSGSVTIVDLSLVKSKLFTSVP